MEVPNRLSLALAAEIDNDTLCQKLNEWSTQVEFLCNPPRPASYQAAKGSSPPPAGASSPATSTTKNSSVGDRTATTAEENDSSPQSAGSSTLQKEENLPALSVVVLDTFSTDGEEELVVDDDSIVANLSARLHYKMLESLTIAQPQPSSTNGTIGTDHHHHVVDTIPNYKAIQEFATTQIAAWKNNAGTSSSVSLLLASILRASKNWIRWYLQIYSAKVKRRHIHIVTSNSTSSSNDGNDVVDNGDDDDPIHRFKSRIMLDFYMDLLNHLIIIQQRQTDEQQATNNILARHVALLLFYATFDPIPPDTNTTNNNDEQEEQQHVAFFQNILNLLIHVAGGSSAIPLALALMRNVHNAAATVHHSQKGAAFLAMARASVVVKKGSAAASATSDAAVCPWAPLVPRLQQQQQQQQQHDDDDDDDDSDGHENGHESEQELTFTYLTVFCNMIAFCLRNQVPTPFPGNQRHSDHYRCSTAAAVVAAGGIVADERAELVCEILRTLYASRIGQEQLAASSRSTLDQLDQEQQKQPHLHRLILDLLQLGHADNADSITFDSDQRHRITECQLDTVSLLMDCGPGLMEYILTSQQAVDALLSLLDRQVECVVEQCRTTLKRVPKNNNSASTGDASAMLTPILVVVHRFCQSSPTFRRQAFLFIFPESAESNYQRLVKAQERENQVNNAAAAARGGRGGILNNNNKRKPSKINMSPLDAPVDTKRWRMIQLLTCVPQSSHIKRFTGELLWLLCHENPQDFTHRVGLGNAMPILAVKGFAQLPTNTFS